MSIRLDILVTHNRYFVADEEFIDLVFSGSHETMRAEKTVAYTIRMTEDSGEVDHGASPPVYERVGESFEGPIDALYNTAAAEILGYFQTEYPGLDFYLGSKVRTPQLIQNQIDEAAGYGSSAQNALSAYQDTVNGQLSSLNTALTDHANENVTQLAGKQDVITPGAPIADATNSTDVVDRFNELLAQLRTQGLTGV